MNITTHAYTAHKPAINNESATHNEINKTESHATAGLKPSIHVREDKSISQYQVTSTQTNRFSEEQYIEAVKLMRSLSAQMTYNDASYERHHFHHIKRVELPFVKGEFIDHPDTVLWHPYIKAAHQFLDADYGLAIARQTYKLIEKIDTIELSDKAQGITRSREEIFLSLLDECEKSSGFSEQVSLSAPLNDEVDTAQFGRIVASGILTEKQFMALLQKKHPLNDFGASIQHGVFTHRLQWYLFARELNDYPEKYQHLTGSGEPLNTSQLGDFYAKLGDKSFQSRFNFSELRHHRTENAIPPFLNAANLWVQIFDRYGYDGYLSVPSTFGFMKHLGFFDGLPIRSEPSNPNACAILEKIKEHWNGERPLSNNLHELLKIHR